MRQPVARFANIFGGLDMLLVIAGAPRARRSAVRTWRRAVHFSSRPRAGQVARSAGFSLVELTVVLAVAAILAMAAAPSFADLIRSNRIATANNDLVATLQYARAEAVQRGRPVSVCASGDGATCSGGSDWSPGWIVLLDGAAAGTPTALGGAAGILRVWQRQPPQVRIAAVEDIGYYRFNPDGSIAWPGAGGGASRTLLVSAERCRGSQARAVIVNRIGRVRMEERSCS